jgi:hypothetical protein
MLKTIIRIVYKTNSDTHLKFFGISNNISDLNFGEQVSGATARSKIPT